jgi:hypothetical protein
MGIHYKHPINCKGEFTLNKKRAIKNFMYEVEVSDSDHNEEFALELFEMMEDATYIGHQKRINSFDELLEWNEQLEEE